jgi:Zn-dependent peptidase ImmA (M78 family)
MNMTLYKNQSLNKIVEKFNNLDFSDIDNIFVVQVGKICEKLQLKAEFKKLQDGLSGYLDPEIKTIFINENYPAARNLFTVAHEIGHYVLHDGTQNRFDQYHKYTTEELQRERQANEFAGELLMPKYKFGEVFKELQGNVKRISDFFGVSQRAIEVRAFYLGLIDNI